MNKIRLEIRPWLSTLLNPKVEGPLVLEKEIPEGATLGDLLKELIAEHEPFGEVLFDPETQQPRGSVSIIINHQFLHLPNVLDIVLKDDDAIMLLPFIDGG